MSNSNSERKGKKSDLSKKMHHKNSKPENKQNLAISQNI